MKPAEWIRRTLEDGEKPSLARQLIIALVAFTLLLVAGHAVLPTRVATLSATVLEWISNLLEGLMMWAGWSRGVTAVKAGVAAKAAAEAGNTKPAAAVAASAKDSAP